MKFTLNWLKDHLSTKKTEVHIIDALNKIGLEVETVQPTEDELSDFVIAKIIKSEQHPNADRLKICDVDIGNENVLKVVCGAQNAKDGLITIYAPPGSTIPKNNMIIFPDLLAYLAAAKTFWGANGCDNVVSKLQSICIGFWIQS